MTSLRILALLVVILSVVIFLQTEGILKDSQTDESKNERSSASSFSPISPSPSTEPTEQLAVTAEPAEQAEQRQASIDDYRYPGATVKVANVSSLTLESSDDVTVITSWYEEKIREKGLGTKTFVKTNTNGEINNKLVGANATTEISIQIVKQAGSNIVITVTQN